MPTTAYIVGSLDDYLNRICEQIQLTDTQFSTAVKRYQRVGACLTDGDTPLQRLAPKVFPQGSMLQRTTIRPTRLGKEVLPFDIDTVCRGDVDPYSTSSQSLYGSILSRLQDHDDFKERIAQAREEFPVSGKCIRLAYLSDDFYLDVIPACKDPADSEGVRLLMCEPGKWNSYNRPIETWRRTDPFRFAAWLQAQTETRRVFTKEQLLANVAPVPPQEPTVVKAPLRRMVQILKRQRDQVFLGDACRPASIMLTTLAGRNYRGETSIADGLQTILDGIAAEIAAAGSGRLVVRNPTDELAPHDGGVEDLAKPLDAAAYDKYRRSVDELRRMLDAARAARGVPELYPVLAKALGEKVVKRAFNAAEEDVQHASTSGVLGAAAVGSGIRILTEPKVSAGVLPVRGSNFHRND